MCSPTSFLYSPILFRLSIPRDTHVSRFPVCLFSSSTSLRRLEIGARDAVYENVIPRENRREKCRKWDGRRDESFRTAAFTCLTYVSSSSSTIRFKDLSALRTKLGTHEYRFGVTKGECKLLCKTQFSRGGEREDASSVLRFVSTREWLRETFAMIKKAQRRITGIFSAKMPRAHPTETTFIFRGQRKRGVSGIHLDFGVTFKNETFTVLLKIWICELI